MRKSNHHDFLRTTAHAEVAAENDHSVEDEKRAIDVGCTKLGVRIKEIDPDGHWSVVLPLYSRGSFAQDSVVTLVFTAPLPTKRTFLDLR